MRKRRIRKHDKKCRQTQGNRADNQPYLGDRDVIAVAKLGLGWGSEAGESSGASCPGKSAKVVLGHHSHTHDLVFVQEMQRKVAEFPIWRGISDKEK